MIPIAKLFILLTRKITKPVSNKTKYYILSYQKNSKYHLLESKITKDEGNNSEEELNIVRLDDDEAFEKGIGSFYEILFYLLLIGVPSY